MDLKAELNIKEDERVIIHVSNFRKVKRIPDILDSFAALSKRMPCKLILVGDGPEMGAVNKQIKKLGLRDQVILLGKQENLHELYAISDACVLMSEKESFGLVLLEAMVHGVPCIGTNIGGIPEVIQDGVNGYIVEKGDTGLAAEKLYELLNDDEIRQEMGENAIRIIREHFETNRIVDQYEDLYASILAEEGP